MTSQENRPRRLAMLLYPGVSAIDVAGPLETFELANYLGGKQSYELMTVSCDGAVVMAAGGCLSFQPTHSFETTPDPLDTLLLAGGATALHAGDNPRMIAWIRDRASRAGRVGSICTGAFVLAAAGLTSDRRVATHWGFADELARLYPGTTVDADAIFVESQNVWSSAGMTAGIDLALGMIEKDMGRALALKVARYLVLYLKRSSGQSQFSMHLQIQSNDTPSIQRVQDWILEHPGGDLSIKRLATIGGLGERTLSRLFADKTGKSPGEYVAHVRLRHACGLLEDTEMEIKEIAFTSGFGTDTNLRKTFMKRLGVSPSQYRKSFGQEGGHQTSI